MKIAVLTLGCRTNQAESAHIEQMLQASGHQTVDSTKDAEICIINTCSVTSKADYQSRQLIARAMKTDAQVIVTGCYAELNSSFLGEKHPNIRVIRNADKGSIISMIPETTSCSPLTIMKGARHRPVIKVQDGCNNECSYCIIPKARGRSLSISPEDVVDRVVYHQSLGFEEVVISGIHLGMYGRDLSPDFNLAKLLQLLLQKTSIRRIRLSSIEINEISDELLELFTDVRLCKHLHLPLQSGDNTILKMMNRSYRAEEFSLIINNINYKIDNMAIGTDLIAGFPGESSDQFCNTLTVIESLDLSYLHVFPYSIRPGTKAAHMKDQVPAQEKKDRVQRLRDLGQKKKTIFINSNIGREHEMLVEEIKDDVMTGTTSNFIRVRVPCHDSLKAGTLVRIRLTEMLGETTFGFPIRTPELAEK